MRLSHGTSRAQRERNRQLAKQQKEQKQQMLLQQQQQQEQQQLASQRYEQQQQQLLFDLQQQTEEEETKNSSNLVSTKLCRSLSMPEYIDTLGAEIQAACAAIAVVQQQQRQMNGIFKDNNVTSNLLIRSKSMIVEGDQHCNNQRNGMDDTEALRVAAQFLEAINTATHCENSSSNIAGAIATAALAAFEPSHMCSSPPRESHRLLSYDVSKKLHRQSPSLVVSASLFVPPSSSSKSCSTNCDAAILPNILLTPSSETGPATQTTTAATSFFLPTVAAAAEGAIEERENDDDDDWNVGGAEFRKRPKVLMLYVR